MNKPQAQLVRVQCEIRINETKKEWTSGVYLHINHVHINLPRSSSNNEGEKLKLRLCVYVGSFFMLILLIDPHVPFRIFMQQHHVNQG